MVKRGQFSSIAVNLDQRISATYSEQVLYKPCEVKSAKPNDLNVGVVSGLFDEFNIYNSQACAEYMGVVDSHTDMTLCDKHVSNLSISKDMKFVYTKYVLPLFRGRRKLWLGTCFEHGYATIEVRKS